MSFFNRRTLICSISAIAIFILAGIYITFPLIFHLTNFSTGVGDEYLIAWIMNWNIHSFLINPLNIFNANIYYPYENTLAYSDTFFISSLIALIPTLILKEPLVTINFTFITSLVLLGSSMFILIYYQTRKFHLSIVMSLLLMFSPAVIDKRVHLQILSIEWVPLAMVFFLKYLDTNRIKFLVLSLLFFLIQIYNSFLPAYFVIFSYIILLIFYLLLNNKSNTRFFQGKVLVLFILTFIAILPLVFPYYAVSREFHFRRDIREAIHLALQPEDYFFPSDATRLQPLLMNWQNPATFPKKAETKPGYMGFIFSLLGITGLIYCFIKWRRIPWTIKGFTTLSIFGFIMSLGPALHLNRETIHYPFLIPLPYGLFYYTLPGFQGMRNSARWEMLFIISLLVIIAYFLEQIFLKFSSKIYYIFLFLILLFSVLEFKFPLHYTTVQTKEKFPKVYAWINTTPSNSKIVELPIFNWYMGPSVLLENQREYYSTQHFRKMINGASGFSPEPWQELVRGIWKTFPSKHSIAVFKSLGINYIIIHKKEFDFLSSSKVAYDGVVLLNGQKVIAICNNTSSLKFIKSINEDYIYQIK